MGFKYKQKPFPLLIATEESVLVFIRFPIQVLPPDSLLISSHLSSPFSPCTDKTFHLFAGKPSYLFMFCTHGIKWPTLQLGV